MLHVKGVRMHDLLQAQIVHCQEGGLQGYRGLWSGSSGTPVHSL